MMISIFRIFKILKRITKMQRDGHIVNIICISFIILFPPFEFYNKILL